MKTITHLSRNSLIIFVGLVLLFLLNCSEDPSSPQKEDEDPIPQDIVTIGKEGGTIEKGDFTITIPAGAFNGDYDISVIEVVDDGAFGENTVSSSYKIMGLPTKHSFPLKVAMKYKGELEGENYLGIGHYIHNKITKDSSLVHDLFIASDSSGYLTSTIPVISQANPLYKFSEEVDEFDVFVKFISSYTSSRSQHFKIVYPIFIADHFAKIAEVFENAYTIVFEGFQISSLHNYDERQTEVFIYSSGVAIDNKVEQDLSLTFYVSQQDILNQTFNEIQVGAVQGLFRSDYLLETENDWISFSIYSWIEDLISDSPNYKYPLGFIEHGMESVMGFNTTNTEYNNLYSHGNGMSAVFKYLYNTKDISDNRYLELYEIGDIYKNDLDLNIMTRLLISVEPPVNEWWPDYYKKLVNNELFELPNDYFINKANAEWTANTGSDLTKTFNSTDVGTYRDLSAKVFEINLNYTDYDNTQNLSFKINGQNNSADLSLILFSIKNNKLEYIAIDHDSEYELKDLDSYMGNQPKQLLAMVVNSNITTDDYLGQSEIDLTIKVSPKIEPPTCSFDPSLYDQCQISLWVLAEKQTTNENGTTTEQGTLIYNTQIIEGSFDGNTFTGIFESESVRDTISVTLNENMNMVESLTRSGVEENTEWKIYWEKGYTAKDIPLNCDSKNKFETKGLDVCSKISEIIYNYTTPIYSTTLTDFSCEEVSSIVVEFSKK